MNLISSNEQLISFADPEPEPDLDQLKGEFIFNLNIFNIFILYLLNAFILPALGSLNGLLNSCSYSSDDKKSDRVIFKRHDKICKKKKQHRKKKDSYGHNHLPHLVDKEDKDYSSHSSGILQKVEKNYENKHESATSYPYSIDKEDKDSSHSSGILQKVEKHHENKHESASSYPYSIDIIKEDKDSSHSSGICKEDDGYYESKHEHSSSYPHSIDEDDDKNSLCSCEICEENERNHNNIRSDCSCPYCHPVGNAFPRIGFPAPYPYKGISIE